MAAIQIVPKSVADLQAIVKPAGGLEFYPHGIFDTQSYVSATTVQLTYFTGTNADATLNNLEQPGALPENTYFEIHRIMCDPFIPPTTQATSAAPAALLDIWNLLFGTGRGIFTLFINSKKYGEEVLSMFHGTGGPIGFMAMTAAASNQTSYANNGVFDGGWYVGGRLVISPKSSFKAVLNWAAAQTLAAGNSNIRLVQQGVYYRPIQ